MAIERTYAEINEKIKSGKAVVLTAEEVLSLVEEKGVSGAAPAGGRGYHGNVQRYVLLRRLPELWTPQTPHQNAKSVA
jgi:hypothetical protein